MWHSVSGVTVLCSLFQVPFLRVNCPIQSFTRCPVLHTIPLPQGQPNTHIFHHIVTVCSPHCQSGTSSWSCWRLVQGQPPCPWSVHQHSVSTPACSSSLSSQNHSNLFSTQPSIWVIICASPFQGRGEISLSNSPASSPIASCGKTQAHPLLQAPI